MSDGSQIQIGDDAVESLDEDCRDSGLKLLPANMRLIGMFEPPNPSASLIRSEC